MTIWQVLCSTVGSNTGREGRVVFIGLIGEEKANGNVGVLSPGVLSIWIGVSIGSVCWTVGSGDTGTWTGSVLGLFSLQGGACFYWKVLGVFLLDWRVLFTEGSAEGGYPCNLLDTRPPGMWNSNFTRLEVKTISGCWVISIWLKSGLCVDYSHAFFSSSLKSGVLTEVLHGTVFDLILKTQIIKIRNWDFNISKRIIIYNSFKYPISILIIVLF